MFTRVDKTTIIDRDNKMHHCEYPLGEVYYDCKTVVGFVDIGKYIWYGGKIKKVTFRKNKTITDSLTKYPNNTVCIHLGG